MSKNCLRCKKEFTIGRIDKKFCNDYCRNNYNNIFNKDRTNTNRNTNNRLRKNEKILYELASNFDHEIKITKKNLLEKGFDFNLFTSNFEKDKEKIYVCVYEYCYRLDVNDECFVIEKPYLVQYANDKIWLL